MERKTCNRGGGVLINQAVHTLDLLSDLLGKPDWIDASLSNHHLKGLIEVEGYARGVYSFW